MRYNSLKTVDWTQTIPTRRNSPVVCLLAERTAGESLSGFAIARHGIPLWEKVPYPTR